MIRAREVRLIGPDGEQLDIMPLKQALQMAEEMGMDLVEIAPQAKPPVCKIMDYGKYRFEQNKKLKEVKKHQKVINVKEVKFRIKIEDHDFQVKAKNAQKFLLAGNKVKVTIMFRGRERSHAELGEAVCLRLAKQMEDISVVEKPPKAEGRNMIMILSPKSETEMQAAMKARGESEAPAAEDSGNEE